MSPSGEKEDSVRWVLSAKKLSLSVIKNISECQLHFTDDDPLRVNGKTSNVKRTHVVTTVHQQNEEHIGGRNDVVALKDGEIDPLNALMANIEMNPPKQTERIQRIPILLNETPLMERKNEYLDDWTMQKDSIFQKFAAERFHIKIDANDDATDSDVKKKVVYSNEITGNPMMKRAHARLEFLENKGTIENTTVEVSQSEYISRIKALQQDFLNAWHEDLKVLALRITIKCIKLLGDTSFPKFYPCMFVLVSDVLDCFGSHVYNRIKQKADESHPLPANFTSGDVDIEAKETCRNWFYKTACIRELLPRIYTEIALLRCYRFLCDGEYPHIVARLSNMIKGIGDPTVALYTRTYLALSSSRVLNEPNTVMLQSMEDYMYIMHRFGIDKAAEFYSCHGISEADLRSIHAPGVAWLMKSVSIAATEKDVDRLIYHYKQYAENGMILEEIVNAFSGKFLAKHTMSLVQLIQQTNDKVELFRCLCLKLVDEPPPESEKLVFLNEVWGTITRLLDIHAYLRCAAAFAALLVTHYSSREVVILLKDVVRHLNSTESMDAALYLALESIMEVIILESRRQTHYFTTIIPSTEFLTLLGMFQHSTNITLSKRLLHAFVRGKDRSLRLAVEGPHASIVHILLSICTRVHDALDSLSSSLELQEASQAICTFLWSLDMGISGQEESLLQIYVECRRVFYKLDHVKSCLIHRVLWLSRLVDCRSRRSFVKGCLAYCHITIPSLTSGLERFQLMTLCAKIALASHCLPQMDAFLKAAIVLMTELPTASEQADLLDEEDGTFSKDLYEQTIVHAMQDLLSLLVVVPSASMEDPLYYVHGFRNGLSKFMWLNRWNQTRVLLQLVPFLATWVPDQPFPYAIGHLVGNDVLFGGDRAFSGKLNEELASVLDEMTRELHDLIQDPQHLDHRTHVNIHCDILLDLVNVLASSISLNRFGSRRIFKLMSSIVMHEVDLHDDIKSYWYRTRAYLLDATNEPPVIFETVRMRRSGRSNGMNPSLHLLTHAMVAKPPDDSKKHFNSPKKRLLHRQSIQVDGSKDEIETVDEKYDDFYTLLESTQRTSDENEQVQDYLLHRYKKAYQTLLELSQNNPIRFHDFFNRMTIERREINDYFVQQDITPSGSIFIVLSGTCTQVIKRHRFYLVNESNEIDYLTWKTLEPGDLFGFESIYYQFPYHYISLRSDGCIERNEIGISTVHPTQLLVLSAYSQEKTIPVTYFVDKTLVTFLQNTHLFQSLPHPSLEFLASHLTSVIVKQDEYLYTTGQPPSIYLVYSGELRVYTVEDVILADDGESEVVTRRVELQILKSHDCTGLAEVCLNSTGFQNYCVASAESKVFIVPTYALFSVVKPGMAVHEAFLEYFTSLRNWYKLRRFTALNRHNKRVEYKLSCSMQRMGQIPCPRCGLLGHLSDSMQCEYAAKSDTIDEDSKTQSRAAICYHRHHSIREAFLQRRITAAERDLLVDDNSLPEISKELDCTTALVSTQQRLDRALGLQNSPVSNQSRPHSVHTPDSLRLTLGSSLRAPRSRPRSSPNKLSR